MPHQCTSCGATFPDGSQEMLSGCPACGGTTFQYQPELPDDADLIEDPAQASARTDTVDEPILSDPAQSTPATSTDSKPLEPSSTGSPDTDSASESTPPAQSESAEAPDLDELRSELDDQFESIKILRPGEYELNLMELYNRDEYIISLLEDGRYAIEVPEGWETD